MHLLNDTSRPVPGFGVSKLDGDTVYEITDPHEDCYVEGNYADHRLRGSMPLWEYDADEAECAHPLDVDLNRLIDSPYAVRGEWGKLLLFMYDVRACWGCGAHPEVEFPRVTPDGRAPLCYSCAERWDFDADVFMELLMTTPAAAAHESWAIANDVYTGFRDRDLKQRLGEKLAATSGSPYIPCSQAWLRDKARCATCGVVLVAAERAVPRRVMIGATGRYGDHPINIVTVCRACDRDMGDASPPPRFAVRFLLKPWADDVTSNTVSASIRHRESIPLGGTHLR